MVDIYTTFKTSLDLSVYAATVIICGLPNMKVIAIFDQKKTSQMMRGILNEMGFNRRFGSCKTNRIFILTSINFKNNILLLTCYLPLPPFLYLLRIKYVKKVIKICKKFHFLLDRYQTNLITLRHRKEKQNEQIIEKVPFGTRN